MLGLGIGTGLGALSAADENHSRYVRLSLLIAGGLCAAGGTALVAAWLADRHCRTGPDKAEASRGDLQCVAEQSASLVAWELAEAERDTQRRTLAELQGELVRAVRAELHAGDGDRTLVIGSGLWGRGMRGVVLTDRRVLLLYRKRGGRFIVKAAWPREAVRVATWRERGAAFLLASRNRTSDGSAW